MEKFQMKEMNTVKTILVSGASGIVGYGALRSLRQHSQKLRLLGSSIYDDSIAPAFCDEFIQAPLTSDAVYLPWLVKIIQQYQIDLIIPGIEIDLYTWIKHVPAIQAAGATPLLNNPALIDLCQDKWAFYESLNAAALNCTITSSLSSEFDDLVAQFGLPFLLKPRRGFASKGIVRVTNLETFKKHLGDMGGSLMAQPIVGQDDEEYTTSAFCDGQGGFYAHMTLKRKLSKDGFTEKAQVVPNDEFVATLTELCQHLRPIGPTNFQFRKCNTGIKLLEINPRVSSSTAIRTAFGYNECAMAVDYFLENKIPVQPPIRRGKAIRYTDEHIFYETGFYL